MRIGFFGDSFTRSKGDPEGLGWVGRLCQKTGHDAVNFGVDGNTSTDVLERWRYEADGASLDRLVFCFGSNDCRILPNTRITVGQVDRLKNAKAIMMGTSKTWPTLFISPFPIADDEKANDRIRDMARQLGAVAQVNKTPYLNIFDAVHDAAIWRDEALAADGAHPGAAAYALVADLIAAHPVWQAWFTA